ncbi:OmpA family protein [Pseudooctadecabacter jejudonensis]|uniref:OmpA family protein n=1 Tax=Pseudooctadecabacter jejudonensis TaxID=1391910 RepID=A0A1Y5S7D3_9RHOB|nr:OmpA family protein [Pseudooctadecabacter jejudonensis]SLN34100.1 OmpA family protein [Pseudooctadecabacter jejudonensis]
MTWARLIRSIRLRKLCAAIFAALVVCAGPVLAEDVTFRSDDNAVVVTGRFVAFDGAVVTVATPTGPLSFRANGMECEGAGCPDLDDYVPNLRMVGAARIADVLMPSLIDAYAREKGWTVREDTSGFALSRQDGTISLEIALNVAPAEAAFDLFVDQFADVLLSVRELTTDEVSLARARGLGRLDTARQARILALDALVPVTKASVGNLSIDMGALAEAFAGANATYSVVTSADIAAQMSGFEDRMMRPFGLSLTQDIQAFETVEDVTDFVSTTADRLALVPYGLTRNAQPLALKGACGLEARAAFLPLKTEDYPLTFPMFLYLPQRERHPRIDAFLDWLRSPSAQLVIRRAGFVDQAAVPIPLADQGDRLANAIVSAGVEVPLGELQRMIRVLAPQVRMSSTFRFEPGSTRLDGQSRSNVMQLAQAIRDGRFGNRQLMFVGFSDGRGPADANRDLSAARADAVRRAVEAALGSRLPNNVTLDIDAFGEALPMACDDTIWGQQINRRVELWVSDAG